jgi:prepilin-type N-terminal cleavage/methylation domain-containing protein
MKLRRGFSLLELIVVVFLISLIYALIFSNLQKNKDKPKMITPLNLKEKVGKLIGGEGEFFCILKCKECYYSKSNATTINRYKGKLALGELEVYILDADDNFEKIEYARVDDEKLCIRYNIYSNKSNSKMVIKNKTGYFYIPSYFGNTQKVEDLDEAKEIWLKYSDKVSSSGDFY